MNKEQQIEELHDFILNNLYKGSTHLLAEKLYNAGYRKIDSSAIIVVDEPFYSEERDCWCVYQKCGDIVQTLFMTEEQAKVYKRGICY